MTDTATKCNATLNAAMWNPKGWDGRVHVCDSPPDHALGHTSVPSHGEDGMVWDDSAVGAKGHQIRHRLDASDPEYLLQLLDQAWGVIANAGIHNGGWDAQDPEWLDAAKRWRNEWHEVLRNKYGNHQENPMTDTLTAKTNAERIDDVIDMLDLATAGRGIDGECLDQARASAEVLRGEIQAGR